VAAGAAGAAGAAEAAEAVAAAPGVAATAAATAEVAVVAVTAARRGWGGGPEEVDVACAPTGRDSERVRARRSERREPKVAHSPSWTNRTGKDEWRRPAERLPRVQRVCVCVSQARRRCGFLIEPAAPEEEDQRESRGGPREIRPAHPSERERDEGATGQGQCAR
jgi:hypothetical protein